jgi:acetylornithine deacetylase/succinyl-diaminopimelate desuccinylase-like protein
MKTGVAAYLAALRGLQDVLKGTQRWIRVALVTGEERESEGTNAAKPFLYGAQWGISTEIPVKGNIDDLPTIYHARPGRALFDVAIEGEAMHMGAANPRSEQLLFRRFAEALKAVGDISLPEHPEHPPGFMPPSVCIPKRMTSKGQEAMTTERLGTMVVEALYTNPALELPHIESTIREALQRVLSEKFSVELSPTRKTPWVKPWYENSFHALVKAAQETSLVVYRTDSVCKRSGRGVGDENILANWGTPMVIFPPRAQGEHTSHEVTDVSHIDQHMVPFLHQMARYKHSLIEW